MQNHAASLAPTGVDLIRQEAMAFAGIGWLVLDFEGVVRGMDPGAFALLGLADQYAGPDEVLGQAIVGLVDYASQGLLRSEIRRRGRVRGLDWHFTTGQGVEKWATQDAYLYTDPHTGESLVQVVLRDVTEAHLAERALQESRARFWAASQGSLDAFYVLRSIRDGEGNVTDFAFEEANRHAETFFGLDREALLQGTLCTLFPAFGENGFLHRYSVVVESRTFAEVETRLDVPGIASDWIHEQVLPLGDGVAVASKDISARKRMEEALLASEKRLRLFLEHTPAPVAMLDRELRYVACSPRWREDFGLGAAPLEGRSHDAVFGGLSAQWHDQFARCLAGETIRVSAERFSRPDGAPAWVRYELLPWREQQDAVDGIMIFMETITDRIAAEERLRASQERLRMALRSARMGSWEWNIETGEVYWSEEMELLLGRTPGTTPRHASAFEALVHPEDWPAMRAEVMRCLKLRPGQPDGYAMEHRSIRADGVTIWLEALGNFSRDEHGRALRLLGVTREVTERKQAEAERRTLEAQLQHAQKLESLGVLAGGIAHDFNNLLTGVLGNVELAQTHLPEDSPSRRHLGGIERSARRAADLCRQMLAYSGQGKFVVQRTNLNALVDEMAHLLEASISKKAQLTFHLAPDLPDLVCDPGQVCQVIMNLLTNASESLGADSGTIEISTTSCRGDSRFFQGAVLYEAGAPCAYVCLEVRDEGHGMDEATQRRIFDPFFTTKFTGRGLGLSAVLGIVRAHCGAIRIKSAPGEGTRFMVYFPACLEGAPSVTQMLPPQPSENAAGTILFVDDESSILGVMQEYLSAIGFRVLTAADGEEAVEVFSRRHQEIDAVVLDLTMPRKNGEEAFREMQALRKDIPVILTSGYGEDDAAEHYRRAGLASFLQKPYQGSDLLGHLRAVLPGRL
jgi:PAS domain S-box-containing protein